MSTRAITSSWRGGRRVETAASVRSGKPHLCAASLNAQPRMKTLDGQKLTPILGIGTFCTHTVVHSRAVRSGRCVASARADELDWLRGDDGSRRRACTRARCKPGESVAVIGCGGVGDSVIMGAKLAGATTIIAVDIDPTKLEWAKGFGATHTVNPLDGDAVAQIKAITGGNGVNVSFEAVGKAQTIETAIWCRDLAGRCVDDRCRRSAGEDRICRSRAFSISAEVCASRGTATACRPVTSQCWRAGISRGSSISMAW